MKKLFYLLLISFSSIFAQENLTHYCGVNTVDSHLQEFRQISPENYPNETEPVAYNIYFHIITNDDGTRTIPIDEAKIQEAVKMLNVTFNQCNVFFKYRGVNTIPSTLFMEVQQSTVQYNNALDDLVLYSQQQNYYKSDSFNIFITETLLNGGLNLYTGFAQIYGTNMVVKDSSINDFTMIHEMGHCLGLFHTNNIDNGLTENVTRDINSPNYNALTHGDRVHDTPATPLGFANNTVNNCLWTGVAFDPVGVQYQNILLNNIMGPNKDGCKSLDFLILTQGQKERVRWIISHTYPGYNAQRTPIEELYKPFEENQIAGNTIISSSDNIPSNGMANVCRNIMIQHRFQKGFTYQFIDTSSPDPVAAIVSEIPEIKFTSGQFGVKISQLSNQYSTYGSYIHTINVLCTKGKICNLEPYIGGTISSLSNLGSQILTEESLNSQQISDPLLIESLESQKFHIRNKTTISGATNQTTIYKN